MSDWQDRAAALAEELAGRGVLGDGWREAFAAIPRHVFVPAFYQLDGGLVDGDDPAQREEWLAGVYSDTSLITQQAPMPGTDLMIATSSSTRPSLMAHMLDLLQAADGHRVLEIGTGTGYNAALMCHRLGDSNVTSIDLDPRLVAAARDRLDGLGYHPHLAAGDGAAGLADYAPYERIIATCAVPTIPAPWISQLAEGGLIVADVRGELASALVAARKIDSHTVQGRFLPTPGHFMWLRPRPDDPLRVPATQAPFDFTDPNTATSDIPLGAFDEPGFRVLLQTIIPNLGPLGGALHDGAPGRWLFTEDDHSWVEIHPDSTVQYGGPRPLWDTVAQAWQHWNAHARPGPERCGLTVQPGRQYMWLDRADGPYSWLTPL